MGSGGVDFGVGFDLVHLRGGFGRKDYREDQADLIFEVFCKTATGHDAPSRYIGDATFQAGQGFGVFEDPVFAGRNFYVRPQDNAAVFFAVSAITRYAVREFAQRDTALGVRAEYEVYGVRHGTLLWETFEVGCGLFPI